MSNAAPVLSDDGPAWAMSMCSRISLASCDRSRENQLYRHDLHELRTPLMVLGGTSELLLRNLAGPIPEDQRTLLEAMRKNAQTVTALLNT